MTSWTYRYFGIFAYSQETLRSQIKKHSFSRYRSDVGGNFRLDHLSWMLPRATENTVVGPGLALASAGPNARPRHGPLWAMVLLHHRAQSTVLWSFRSGVSNTWPAGRMRPVRAFCVTRDAFWEFSNIINIYVAKCLGKRRHEIIESNLNDTQCGFRPGRSNTDNVSLSSKIWEILGAW